MKRIWERFCKWFRSLSRAQAAWFYVGLFGVVGLTVLHNPTEGYSYRTIRTEIFVPHYYGASKEGDKVVKAQISQAKAREKELISAGWKWLNNGYANGGRRKIFFRNKYSWIDPRGAYSTGAFALARVSRFLMAVVLVVVATGVMVALTGIRKEVSE